LLIIRHSLANIRISWANIICYQWTNRLKHFLPFLFSSLFSKLLESFTSHRCSCVWCVLDCLFGWWLKITTILNYICTTW
jgi:hypothetical protein